MIEPATLAGPMSSGSDDDVVLATALAAQANLIVSRHKHLRYLKFFHRMSILNTTDALA